MHTMHTAHMLTVAVLNQKGGVGKSTLSVNLAAKAHLEGKRTLILDLDRQGSAFDWYNARQPGSRLDGLNVVRADRALTLPKFQDLSKGYDFIVCDGPPRLGDVTRAAAIAADVVLVPVRAGGFDWWASSETIELLDSADDVRSQLGRGKVRRVFILNAATPNTRITRQALDAFRDAGGELAPVVISNRVTFAESVLEGESVLTVPPSAAAAAAAAVDEIHRLYAVLSGEDASHA